MSNHIKDNGIIEKLNKAYIKYSKEELFSDRMKRITENSSYSNDDVLFISLADKSKYYNLLKSPEDRKLYVYLNRFFGFGDSENSLKIKNKTVDVLLNISNESILNKTRVLKYLKDSGLTHLLSDFQ